MTHGPMDFIDVIIFIPLIKKIRFLKSMENKYANANAISFFIFSKTFAKHTFLRRKREILSAAS